MMYGHVETPRQRVEHLIKIRNLQAECPPGRYGFVAFIPWIFRSSGTRLEQEGVDAFFSPLEYLRTIALSRIVLSNIRHIQASWLTVGKQTAQIALHGGADDMGTRIVRNPTFRFRNETKEPETYGSAVRSVSMPFLLFSTVFAIIHAYISH